jgi:hypothetical protein
MGSRTKHYTQNADVFNERLRMMLDYFFIYFNTVATAEAMKCSLFKSTKSDFTLKYSEKQRIPSVWLGTCDSNQ